MATRTLTYILLGKDQLTSTFKKAGKEGEESSKGISAAFGGVGFGAVALAGVIGGVLLKSLKDARGEGWSPLKVAAQDAGIAFSKFKPQAEAAGATMAKLGFSQADVNSSLKILLTTTRNSQLSLKTLGTAADFARFKGVGLAQASSLLAKAATGSTRALKDVGISTADLPKHFATTGTQADRMRVIMELLNKRIGGQAAAAAQTFGGKLAAMHAQLENVSAKIGTALLPILSSLLSMVSKNIMPAVQAFSDWFEKVGAPAIKTFADRLTPIVTGLMKDFFTGVSAIIRVVIGLPGPLKIAGLAIIALGVAMKLAADANPWILLGVAIVTFVGLIINNWAKITAVTEAVWGHILDFIKGIWHDITGAAQTAFNWLKDNWPLILGILTGPIGLAVVEIVKHWTTIKNTAKTAFDAVTGAFKDMWNNGIRPVLKFLIDGWLTVVGAIVHGAATAFGWVPGIGGKLKAAAKSFDTFKNDVNNALGNINNRTVKVSVAMTAATNPYPGGISGRAATGGRVYGPGSGTSDTAGLFALSRDEWVVKASSANKYGSKAMHAVNQGRAVIGYADGGQVGSGLSVAVSTPGDAGITSAIHKPIIAMATRFAKTMMSGIAGVVPYAMSWLGKIPYVWGGTAIPGGADCSGFTQAMYKHVGVTAPRTSEAQYAWAKQSGAIPGALAFYISSAGGAPPGHVAIVKDANTVISQGGGMGPQLEALHFMSLMGTGVPPGYSGAGGGFGNAAPNVSGSIQSQAMALLNQRGWGNTWPSFNALENREAGWNMNARNPSSGAYGLAQFINGAGEYAQYGGTWLTGIGQLVAMMNYIAQRYGNPDSAWNHESLFGWYGSGTNSARKGWAMVGERGPELVKFRGGESVIANKNLGGSVNYNVSVYVSPLAHPADTGRAVVNSIKEFERSSGSSWRN